MIEITWYNIVAIVAIIFLGIQTLRDHSDGRGGYFDFSFLINVFWFAALLLFVAIWGGIFWW